MGLLKFVAVLASLFVANAFAPAAWSPARPTTALNSIMDAGSPAKVELDSMKSNLQERLDKKLAEMLSQVETEMPDMSSASTAGLDERLDKIESMLKDLKAAVA